jgi:hypothetical protein
MIKLLLGGARFTNCVIPRVPPALNEDGQLYHFKDGFVCKFM